jgi:hypothetical protein
MPFGFLDSAHLAKRLLLNRKGQRVPLIRNYPLQYFVAGTLFLLVGLATLALGNAIGFGLIAFGLIGYMVAGVYYKFF